MQWEIIQLFFLCIFDPLTQTRNPTLDSTSRKRINFSQIFYWLVFFFCNRICYAECLFFHHHLCCVQWVWASSSNIGCAKLPLCVLYCIVFAGVIFIESSFTFNISSLRYFVSEYNTQYKHYTLFVSIYNITIINYTILFTRMKIRLIFLRNIDDKNRHGRAVV